MYISYIIGTIDRAELQNGFKQLGLELDRGQVVKLMNDYNQDDDKDTLTEQEFSNAVKKWSRVILKKQNTNYASALRLSEIHQVSFRGGGDAKEEPVTVEDDSKQQQEEQTAKDKSDKAPLNKKETKPKSYQSMGVDDDEEEQRALIEDKEESVVDPEKDVILDDLWKDLNMEAEMEEEDEEQFLHLSDKQLITYALFQLGLGTFLCCIFSDPMVSVIGTFSDTIGISSFFVSFIVTPIASNASEIYSSLLFAGKKTKEGISMSFSALYGAACMNNTFVLCIFCALVFFRRLQWTFIAETLVILLTVIVVGINGMKETVTVWQGFLVISLFPLSLVLVAILDPVLDDVTKC